MQITKTKILDIKYAEFYLSSEEFEQEETKDKIKEYKLNKYKIGIFITGKENYPEILEKIVVKELNLNSNEC